MSNFLRLAIGASAIGTVAGAGILLNKFLSTDDIQIKLKKNNLEILSTSGHGDLWKRILSVYKEVSKLDSKFKFDSENVETLQDLQKQCQEVFKKRIGEDNEKNNYYGKAKRWCTVPISVLKLLEREITIFNTESEKDEADQEGWNKKIKEYQAPNNKDTITGLNLKTETTEEHKKENRIAIKAECKKINEKQSYEEGYEEAIKKSKTWCSIEKKIGL